MAITVHVFPAAGKGWAVKREARKAADVFPTQHQAIENARSMARSSAPGQFVVHGKDGRIREYTTYGLPRIQAPRGKSRHQTLIEKVVAEFALEQLTLDPPPAREQTAKQ